MQHERQVKITVSAEQLLKALEKERGRRYETANALMLDIQRYLDDHKGYI